MFSFFSKPKAKPPKGEDIVLSVVGMHCTSCALTIDGELEDTPGVLKASTSYARSELNICFDPQKISVEEISEIIRNLGYETK